MNIIICNKHTFKYFEDYIYSIINIINAQLLLFEQDVDIHFIDENNYIFLQNIDNKFLNYIGNNSNIYLLNTEQLSVEKLQIQINSYPKNVIIIDYSHSNFKYYYTEYKQYFLPYQINYNEIFDYKKVNDVCLIGTIDNIPTNRQHIIDLLKEKNIHVDIVSGFGKERDITLFKYKIILNIGYYPDNYRIFENIRCDRCVYNNMIVISDIKEDIDDYYLKDHVIFTDYSNIPAKVIEVLSNYESYYNKLFSNFDLDHINFTLNKLAKPLIEKLSITE